MRWGAECFQALKRILKEIGLSTTVGDEGGFAPQVSTASEVMELLMQSIEAAGLEPGDEVALAIDPAASELQTGDGHYHLEGSDRTSGEMLAFWTGLIDRFPVVSLEDGDRFFGHAQTLLLGGHFWVEDHL